MKAALDVADIEVTAASSRSPSAVAEISAEYGIEHQFSDWRALVTSHHIDAVVICLPDGLHAQVTVEAATHGKHVLVEKAMGNNLGQCKTMVSAADQAGVVLMVGQVVRQFNSHQLAKRMIQDGKIGSVSRAIRRRHFPQSILAQLPRNTWMTDPLLCTDPLLFGLGSHEYDAFLWLFESEAKQVVAKGKKDQAVWPGWLSIEGSVGLRNGVEVDVSLSMQADEQAWDTQVEGAKGLMTIYNDRVVVDGEEIECLDIDIAFAAQLNEFADCVRGEREPGPSGRNVLGTGRGADCFRPRYR
jgi:predicted dehydrogenase